MNLSTGKVMDGKGGKYSPRFQEVFDPFKKYEYTTSLD